ncbi:hypothetical protein A0H81_11576 [Grifola frondosa]|uniref:Uncharacterized protein n=1 Tax=Grifola frondosa TaxID=5627 RepID=A0A1C7LVN4_GRIFR|nr:hypothetical protein A0H81_11576 [Grifola frondosa]
MQPQASSEQSKNGSSVPPMNGLTPPQSTRSTPPRSEGTAPTTTDEHADAEMEDESSQATDASVIDPSLESTQTSLSQSGTSQAQAPAAADEGDADMKIAAAAKLAGKHLCNPKNRRRTLMPQDVQPQDSSTVQPSNTTVELPANAAQPAAVAATEVEKQQGQIDGVGVQKTEVEGTLELPMPAELSLHRENEQMLTEDGEPMLNPAELLTQESLASPPPS